MRGTRSGQGVRLGIAALAATILAAAEAWAQGTESATAQGAEADGAAQAFEAVYARFSEAYRAGDPQAVAVLYADDAFYLAPGGPIERGDVVRHFAFLDSFEPGTGPVIEFEIVDRDVAGDLAYDIGYYTIRRADAAPGEGGRGKFIVIWKRGADGVWRIHADGYNPADVRAEEGGR